LPLRARALVDDIAERSLKSVDIKALAIAIVATLSLDLLLTVALTSAVLGPKAAFDLQAADADALLANQTFLFWSLVLGTLSTVVGGFLAARFARALPYYHSLIYGIFGLVFSVLTSEGLPRWYNAVGFTVLIPAALVGGYLAKRSGFRT
jgi:hypothetical protein